MPLVSERWAVLRLESLTPLTVVEYRDHSGTPRVLASPPYGPPGLPEPGWLVDRVRELGSRRSPRTGRPPIFLDAHPSLAALDLEAFFAPVLSTAAGPTGVAPASVRLTRAEWLPRRPFTLPLRVAAVGAEGADWFTELLQQSWMQGEDVRRYGLDLHIAARDVEPLLHVVGPHVVVTDQPAPVLELAAALAEPGRPRVVIWVDPTLDSPAPTRPPADVPGVSLLRVSALGSGALARFFTALVREFTHDLPLHEMAESAASEAVLRTRLTADPYSLQSLRLMEALGELQREGRRWETLLPALPDTPVSAWIADSRGVGDFLGESHGFVPMAGMRGRFDVARAAWKAARDQARATLRAVREMRVREPARAVHVALERLETGRYLSGLDDRSSLQAGAAYQVRLHIGVRLPDSLVEIDTPIDPLLGPPDEEAGHHLEVAIQGKDFEVLSERAVPLFLPREGSSEPVYFEVSAPERVGAAQLRLCVYHRNHLVQSFLLDAKIDEYECPHPERILTVRLELSRSENFGTLDALGARALSIGLNHSIGGATHELILKADGSSGEVSLPAVTFEDPAKEIRRLLEQAARDPLSPALGRDYPLLARGAPVPADVAATIRGLAGWGRKLYRAFFHRAALPGSKLRPHLVALSGSQAQRIQVIRFEYKDAFPWPLLYDWDLPGDPGASVCLGWQTDATGNAARCSHEAGCGLYCVRGFWGVRHHVEELIAQPGGAVTRVTPPAQGQPVRLVADAGLPESVPLGTDLTGDLGAADIATGPVQTVPLLDLLFQKPDYRPALLILLGHHERQLRAPQPDVSRIRIDSAPQWLTDEDVSSRAEKEQTAWDQPRPVVLLAACSSATTGIDTLTDFVTAWTVSGASAIVGTECVVGSKLAATFSRRFANRVWKKKDPLGKAMTTIRADLLAEGNPLAFLFHAVGDVDLVLR